MGILDKAKEMMGKDDNADKAKTGVDKAADMADDKTGGKYSDKIDSGADAAKSQLDNMDEDQ